MADTPDWLPAALARLARAEAATANARRLLDAAAEAGLPMPTVREAVAHPGSWVLEWPVYWSAGYMVVNVEPDHYGMNCSPPLTDPAVVVAAVRRWLDGEHAPAKEGGEDA